MTSMDTIHLQAAVPESVPESVRESAAQAVVDNLGLIWPDEAEPMHTEVADGVLAVVRAHLLAHLDRAIGDAAGIYDLTEDEIADIVNRVLPAPAPTEAQA